MKNNRLFVILVAVLMFSFSCSEGEDDISNSINNVTESGELTNINDSYLLQEENKLNTIATPTWTAFKFGYDMPIKYILQIDLKGKEFGRALSIVSTSNLSYDVSVHSLNMSVNKLLRKYNLSIDEEHLFELRIKALIDEANSPLHSNVIEAKIKAYEVDITDPEEPVDPTEPDDKNFDSVYIIGTYSNWDFNSSQNLYAYNSANIYEGWIDFSDKASWGFKLTKEANWDEEWGTDLDQWSQAPEASSMILVTGHNNIYCYGSKYYRYSFNKETLELKRIKAMNSFGIAGTATPNGLNGSDIALSYDRGNLQFTVVSTFTDGTIIFRGDNSSADVVYGMGLGEGMLSANGSPITVKAGTYRVSVNINNSNTQRYKIEAVK